MATLAVDENIIKSLKSLGDPVEVAEKAIKKFIIDNLEERIMEIRDRIRRFEKKYDCPFNQFQDKIRTEEGFAKYVEGNIEKTWESDLIEWELDTKELAELERRLG